MAGYRAKPPKGATLNRADPLAKWLAAAHLLSEGSGFTACDATGNKSRDATLTNGPAWSSGPWGKALSFDGSNDYLSCPIASAVLSSGFTVVIDLTGDIASGGTTNKYPFVFGNADDIFGVTYGHTSAAYRGVFYMKGNGTYPKASWGSAAAGERCQIAVSWDGATMRTYKNGVAGGTTSNSTFGTTSNPLLVGSNSSGAVAWPGKVHGVWVYSRPLPAKAICDLAADPFRPFRPRRLPVPVRPSGGGSISGSASVTLGALTLSATGTLAIAGAADVTLNPLTLSATGTVAITGALDATLDALTITATGALNLAGAVDVTLGSLSLTSTGAVAITGALDATLGPLTLTSTGALAIAGAVDVTLGALTLSATGEVAISGLVSITLDALTLSSSGALAVTGAVDVTLGELVVTAAGTLSDGPTGTASITLGPLALSATGTIPVTGSLSVTLGALTVAATGTSLTVSSDVITVTFTLASCRVALFQLQSSLEAVFSEPAISEVLFSGGVMTPADASFRVGAIGVALVVQFVDENGGVIPIGAATTLQISIKKPAVGGTHTVMVKTASLYTDGSDGKAVWRTVAGDFDVAGFYQIEGYAVIGTSTVPTAREQFPVLNTNQTEDA